MVESSQSQISEQQTPKLLFILNADEEKLKKIKGIIGDQDYFNLAKKNFDVCLREIHKLLQSKIFDGVVIIGSYCSVPSKPLHILDSDLLKNFLNSFKNGKQSDLDYFIVWNDDFYVDHNNDSFPELPISRIPFDDIHDISTAFIENQSKSINHSAGIFNVNRLYPYLVFQKNIRGNSNYFPSSLDFQNNSFGNIMYKDFYLHKNLYFVLHGNVSSNEFFGCRRNSTSTVSAIVLGNIPNELPKTVVFNAACWGALIVDTLARDVNKNSTIECRTAENSAALKFLQSGALAYVGSTGSHYSPIEKYAECFCIGVPMHWYFWENIQNGDPPAKALFNAKVKFASRIPHNPLLGIVGKVYELKILFEFTCLGLGW
jgi:hypothetical protein